MTARAYARMAPTAPWAFRLALLPLPLLIIVALLRHFDRIELLPSFLVMAIAWTLGALAVLCGGLAFRLIWNEGRVGFSRALAGSLLGLVVLALPAAILVQMARLPRLADISTDVADPPAFAAAPLDVRSRPLPDAADQAQQLAAYPDIVPRHYPLSPERVFAAIDALVADRGWHVVERSPPDADNALGQMEVEARTFGFAFPVDVAFRLEADEDGTLVDMRSASRVGAHDLGDNARRIRDFFADLDAALQGVTEAGGSEPDDQPLPPLPQEPPPR